jgi:hypothetical protein
MIMPSVTMARSLAARFSLRVAMRLEPVDQPLGPRTAQSPTSRPTPPSRLTFE